MAIALGALLPGLAFVATSWADAIVPNVLLFADHAVHTMHVPGSADFIALEGDDAWVTNEGRVEKLRVGVRDPVASVTIAEPCGALAVDFGSLWVVDCRERTLVRVDLQSQRVIASIPTGVADPEGELSVATGAGSVWLLTHPGGVLTRVDPDSNSVVTKISVAPHSYAAVFGFDAVWVTSAADGQPRGRGVVQRVDPRTNMVVATIPVGTGPRFLAAGEKGIWTLNQGDGTVSRIDPATNTLVATIAADVPGTGGDIAVGAGRVWVRATRTALTVIDPATNGIVARYGPPCGSGAVRVSNSAAWITAHDIQTVWVLKP